MIRHLNLLVLGLWCLFFAGCDFSEKKARLQLRNMGVEVNGETLVKAVEDGDVDLARLLVRAGVMAGGKGGETMLEKAVRAKKCALAYVLLPQGGVLPENASSVLVAAVESGELWLVKDLLERGCDPDVKREEEPLIMWAMRKGHKAAVRLLVDGEVDPLTKNKEGQHLVTDLAKEDSPEFLLRLLRRGAPVDVFDEAGNSLVHLAAQRGEEKVIDELVERRADISHKNLVGETPLHVVSRLGMQDLAVKLVKAGADFYTKTADGEAAIHMASSLGQVALIKTLLDSNCEPELKNSVGQTPLELALAEKNWECAEALVSHGVGLTPLLRIFVEQGEGEAVHFLLKHGASPFTQDGEEAPLAIAVRRGDYEVAKALLEAGASPLIRTSEGQSALHLAVVHLDTPMTRLLLEYGADVNEPVEGEITEGFSEAIRSENISRWLLTRDTRISPIVFAVDSGDLELTKTLLDHGANKLVRTKKLRWYPIAFAARRADIGMMRLLLNCDPHEYKRWVKIDISAQRAWVYDDEEEIFTTRVSTGKKGHRTKLGTFVITNRYRTWTSTLYDSEMPFFQRLSCGDFGLHSGYVPGYPASHGCIRVPYNNAKKLFNILSLGDVVKIVK